MVRDTQTAFGWMSIGLHWINAILVALLLYFGMQIALDHYYDFQFGLFDGVFHFETLERTQPGRTPMVQFAVDWHEAVGIVGIPFFLLRAFWRVRSGKPVTHHQPKFLHAIAEISWRLLLLGIVWQVISGPLWNFWRGNPLHFFHYFSIPSPMPVANRAEGFARHETLLNYFLEYSHMFVALMILAVLVLHIGGALKHHLIDKDVVLKRMLSPGPDAQKGKKSIPSGAEVPASAE